MKKKSIKKVMAYVVILLAAVLILGIARYMDTMPFRKVEDAEVSVSLKDKPQPTIALNLDEEETEPVETRPLPTEPKEQRIRITFAGNCALGGPDNQAAMNQGFLRTVGEDYAYPFLNVKEWFANDDMTLLTMENVLADAGKPISRSRSLRGPVSYVNILAQNSVEAVNLCNDHSMDYGEEGYTSTKDTLKENNIEYVGINSDKLITLEGDILVGIYATENSFSDKEMLASAIKDLKNRDAELIIYAPHWGKENAKAPTQEQIDLAHAAIDAGANIVYGSHPMAVHPIEEYNGGLIIYSLGSLSHGADIYPDNYDTALVRQEIFLSEKDAVRLGERTIVPCSVSSEEKRNNYQPMPYETDSEAYNRVMKKLQGNQ